jgi:hypothetical protein
MTETCCRAQPFSPLTMQIGSEFANANVVNFGRGPNRPYVSRGWQVWRRHYSPGLWELGITIDATLEERDDPLRAPASPLYPNRTG